MKQLILLAFLGTTTVDAAVILTGSVQEWNSIPWGRSWTMQLQGPGFGLGAGGCCGSFHLMIAPVPYCTGDCTYDFSQSLSVGFSAASSWMWNATIGGATYPVVDGSLYRANIDLQLSSSAVTATAVCTLGCGGPFRKLYETEWPAVPFTMSGSVQIYRQTLSEPWTLVASETFSGSGLATAMSWADEPVHDQSETVVTYDFSVPEPSSLSLLLIAAPGLAYAKWRGRQRRRR